MNCYLCKTGVFEPVGEILQLEDNTLKLQLIRFDSDSDNIKMMICSNPSCNHTTFVAGKNTVSKLRKKYHEEQVVV